MEPSLAQGQFPERITVEGKVADVSYTFDREAQAHMEKLFQQYKPDYGAFAAIDARTGRILTLVSYTRGKNELGNLALKAVFPAASIFKIVTAAAAIDQGSLRPSSNISFGGRNHTLYKNHVLKNRSYGERLMSIKEAFARSVNTVFGKIGVFVLKPAELEDYAKKFLFKEAHADEFPMEVKAVKVDGNEPFAMAELASGFERETRLSPLHGALLSASIINDGTLPEPHLVSHLKSPEGKTYYEMTEAELSSPIHPDTAKLMRVLMRETIKNGTARKSFRGIYSKFQKAGIELGGKTGSLTSLAPRGKCDWFVGYGSYPGSDIAVAALTVNVDKWQVKSSYLAREFFDKYYSKTKMKALAYGPLPKPY